MFLMGSLCKVLNFYEVMWNRKGHSMRSVDRIQGEQLCELGNPRRTVNTYAAQPSKVSGLIVAYHTAKSAVFLAFI
jgi:hypothetical protein